MFGRKCTLCGGKLNSSRICTECGLNNNKTEKYYKPNTSSCDYEPLTHVHEDEEKGEEKDNAYEYHEENEQPIENTTQEELQEIPIYKPVSIKFFKNQSFDNASKKKWLTILTIVVTLIGVGVSVFSTLNPDVGTDQSMDVAYEPYRNVTRELSEEGEPAEYVLSSGNYIVGVHIPEGKYRAITSNPFDFVDIRDHENAIYLFEYEETEGNHLEDLRLYDGARIRIGGEDEVKLYTEHAQFQEERPMLTNPLTESFTLTSGTSIAGKDFPAGIYDMSFVTKSGAVDVSIDHPNGYHVDYSLYRGDNGRGHDSFKYMVLPEGAVVECQEESEVELVPTEYIISTDYDGFYI